MNDYLAEIFSKDYQVFRAYNGAEACKLLKKQTARSDRSAM